MPKKLFKKYMPTREAIREQKALAVFGNLLNDPNLWSLNRRSASGAFGVGLFMAFIPLPSQMIMAAGLAILFKVNLPLSVALVWITNPVTMPVIFYGAYKVGTWLLATHEHPFHFELTWDFLLNQMSYIGPPFGLGCIIFSIVFSLLGYFGVQTFWRLSVARSWKKRKLRLPMLKRNPKNKNQPKQKQEE